MKEASLLEVTMDNLYRSITKLERERTVYLQARALQNYPEGVKPVARRILKFEEMENTEAGEAEVD